MALDIADLPWRRRAPADIRSQIQALDAQLAGLAAQPGDQALASEAARACRRIAGYALDPLARIRFGKTIGRIKALGGLPALRRFNLVLLGSGTLSWFADELAIAAPARGLLVEATEGEFDSAAAVAFGAAPLPNDAPADGVLLMLDHSAFAGASAYLALEEEAERLAAAGQYLADMVAGLKSRLAAPVFIATLALPPERVVAASERALPGSLARLVDGINQAILEGARRGDWLVWDAAQLAAEVGTQAWFDPVRLHQSKAPFALEICPLAADHFCRALAALCGKAGRALILDLDNTVWGGVIGDDGLEGIRIGQGSPEGEAFLALQRLVLDLRSRGVVIAVCSKNTDAVAREPFERHPDMLLRLEHVAVFQANWSDKASNISAIAQALDLGFESLVFVDDNPAERERVRQELPLVSVPEIGEDPAYYARILSAGGYFDHQMLGGDDLVRLNAYEGKARKAEMLSRLGNYQAYLASLGMEMTIAPFDAVGRQRIVQLVNKSNQFNLTTRRITEAEAASLQDDDQAIAWQVRLKDSFGDHGMIGVVICRKGAEVWTVDTWLMSCRVLERGVEQAIMNQLVAEAARGGARVIEGVYIPTDRNGLVADFYDRMSFSLKDTDASGRKTYRLTVADYRPFPTEIALLG